MTDKKHQEQAVLEISDLTLQYGSRIIQKDLNFSIAPGEIFIIMGGSGCGKSTLLRHLIGLHQPQQGHIKVLGQDIWHVSDDVREAQFRQTGIVYQRGGLWSTMTLNENIALLLKMYTSCTEKEIAHLCRLKLEQVGLGPYGDFYPSEISGGMQRRAALARACALDPKLLFLDEPSAGLDPVSARRLDELILNIRDIYGATVVVITHDLDSIFTIADRAGYLDNVALTMTACGTLQELQNMSEHHDLQNFLHRGNSSSGKERKGSHES